MPRANLIAPTPNQEFTAGVDESVIIQPDVSDNLSLAYVEVYVDNKKVETSTVAPFTYRWKLGAVGAHNLHSRGRRGGERGGEWEGDDQGEGEIKRPRRFRRRSGSANSHR